MSLKNREFTQQSVFSGMRTSEIVLQEHLPYVLPIVFYTTMNNMNWSIGLEVTLSVLRLHQHRYANHRVMIYWANQHTAMSRESGGGFSSRYCFVVILFIGLFLLAISMNEYIDRAAGLPEWEGCADERRGPPQGARPLGGTARSADRGDHTTSVAPSSAADAGLAPERGAHGPESARLLRTKYFGISREVRAVDGVSLHVDRGEIYGLAGESSCGKTTLIKTIVRAIRPPLDRRRRIGQLQFRRPATATSYALTQGELESIRWRHLSYILQAP